MFVLLYECLNKNKTCSNLIFLQYYSILPDLIFKTKITAFSFQLEFCGLSAESA